jgi:gas vesicle protein
MMTKDDVTGTIFTFVLGVGVGAVVALLMAPKSGERLRGEIADGVTDRLDAIRSTGKDLKRRGQKLVELAKDQFEEAIEAGEHAYTQAKKS